MSGAGGDGGVVFIPTALVVDRSHSTAVPGPLPRTIPKHHLPEVLGGSSENQEQAGVIPAHV